MCNETCQHLEDMHNSVNQHFPNDQIWAITKPHTGKHAQNTNTEPTEFSKEPVLQLLSK